MVRIGKEKEEWELGKDYTILKVLGVGGYGTVCQACHEPTKTVVAIKRMRKLFNNKMDCKRILREVSILKRLNHPNVVKLHDILDVKDVENFNNIYLVMEYTELDLHRLLQSNIYLDIEQVRKLIYNTLVALKYIHSAGVLHRDIKPGNILINKDCSVKICDFGLARTIAGIEGISLKSMRKGKKVVEEVKNNGTLPKKALEESKTTRRDIKRKLSGHVVTRWYRAPEIILMEKDYGPAIDVWSVGCIFGELLAKMKGNTNTSSKASALFPGTSCFPISPTTEDLTIKGSFQYSAKDQLSWILSFVGTPAESDMAFITDIKALEYLKGFEKHLPIKLSTKYPTAGSHALNLLTKMLTFNPFSRITIEECLQHPFFSSIRNIELEKIEAEEIELKLEQEENLTINYMRGVFLELIEHYNKLRAASLITYK